MQFGVTLLFDLSWQMLTRHSASSPVLLKRNLSFGAYQSCIVSFRLDVKERWERKANM